MSGAAATPAVASAAAALAFVEQHGVVLVSAKGPAPRLTDAIAGEPVSGSWWGHAKGKLIFAILGELAQHEDVLVCRLGAGKLTLVHRRLWPALVRASGRFKAGQLAQVREQHSPSGKHITADTPFPLWVPADVAARAADLSEEQALAALGAFAP